MRKCYLQTPTPNKAKADIDEIARRAGFADLAVHAGTGGKVQTFFSKLLTVATLPFRLRKYDVLLIQYPYKKYYATLCRIARLKGAKTVTLIHDLGSWRRKKLTVEQERVRLEHSDVIIVHNESMRQFLSSHGTTRPLVNLWIFDYLSIHQPKVPATAVSLEGKKWTVVYGGGLSQRKNAFLYDLDNKINGWQLHIYGKGLDEEKAKKWENIVYGGFKAPDDFIGGIHGDFGLVWDGSSVDECAGEWGNYLRINNPHKTSFYLRAGMPVIIWRKAAMAKFIKENNAGIVVDSLSEIGERLAAMTVDDYNNLQEGAHMLQEKLATGYFFNKAFDQAIKNV